MEKRIDEIVKIICYYHTDDGKCNCNAHQFGVRECSDPCAYRQIAEQLVDAGYAPVVHGEWIDRDGKTWCSVCHASNKQYKPPYCPHCGAKMDGGKLRE